MGIFSKKKPEEKKQEKKEEIKTGTVDQMIETLQQENIELKTTLKMLKEKKLMPEETREWNIRVKESVSGDIFTFIHDLRKVGRIRNVVVVDVNGIKPGESINVGSDSSCEDAKQKIDKVFEDIETDQQNIDKDPLLD